MISPALPRTRFRLAAALLACGLALPALAAETRLADQELLPASPANGALLGKRIAIAAELGEALASADGLQGVFRYGWDAPTRTWAELSSLTWTAPNRSIGVASGGDSLLFTRTLLDESSEVHRHTAVGSELLFSVLAPSASTVATDGNYIAVGQPSFLDDSGQVLIFAREGEDWPLEGLFIGSAGSRLGSSLAMDGAVVVAGAPERAPHGAVYVFVRTSAWSQLQRLDCPASVGSGARFGASVALAGDNLAVGAPQLDRLVAGGGNIVDIGGVFTYDVAIVGFSLEALVRPAGAGAGDFVGTDVALWRLPGRGLVLAAGAPGEGDAVNLQGAAYLFHHHGNRWTEELRLVDGSPVAGDFIASAVAIGPMGVLAGAKDNSDLGGDSNGAVLAWNGVVPLFYDGFESGDSSGWDVVVP